MGVNNSMMRSTLSVALLVCALAVCNAGGHEGGGKKHDNDPLLMTESFKEISADCQNAIKNMEDSAEMKQATEAMDKKMSEKMMEAMGPMMESMMSGGSGGRRRGGHESAMAAMSGMMGGDMSQMGGMSGMSGMSGMMSGMMGGMS